MKLSMIALAFVSLGSVACSRRADPEPAVTITSASVSATDGMSWTKLEAKGASIPEAIKTEVSKAKGRSLEPIVYIGAVWCDPCQDIKKARKDPRMVDAFKGAHVIELDVDDYTKEELKELKALGFRTGTIPAIQHVNADGRPVGAVIDDDAWGANVPAEMAPVLKKFVARAP